MTQMGLVAHQGTQRVDIGERGGEPSGGRHRVEGLCEGRSGVGGREGRATVEGHKGDGRCCQQGATWWHHAPSRHCPCEGGIVHWKQEDKEVGLSQGSLEKEGGAGRKSGKICSNSVRVGRLPPGLTSVHAQLQTPVHIFHNRTRSHTHNKYINLFLSPSSRQRLTFGLQSKGKKKI